MASAEHRDDGMPISTSETRELVDTDLVSPYVRDDVATDGLPRRAVS